MLRPSRLIVSKVISVHLVRLRRRELAWLSRMAVTWLRVESG